jgi:hypothetical protein
MSPTKHSWIRPRVLVGLLILYVPFYVLYFKSDLPFSLAHARDACGGQPVLDARHSYTAAGAYRYLEACGPAGRAAIVHQQLADLFYPALYAAVLLVAYVLVLRALRETSAKWRLLVVLPMLVAALDYAENVGVWTQMIAYPGHASGIAAFSAITGAKQVLGMASIVVLMCLSVGAGVARRNRRGELCARLPFGVPPS